jgi:hypothetical protein
MPTPAKRSIMAPLTDLFRKKRSLDDLRATRDERVAALELARGRLARSYESRDTAAIEGSDLLDAAEAEMRAAEDRVESLTVAVDAITAEIAAIEQDQAQKRDRAVRESTARDLNARADKFEKLIPLWADVLRDSAAVGELAKPVVGEGIGLFGFFKQIETQIPAAYADIAFQLRFRAGEVLAGRAPAALPTPEPQPVAAEPIPRQTVFLLKDAKWRNPARPHEFELGERFSFANVPAELAAKALESGVAILPESEQAQKWKFNKRGAPPIPEKCIDIETGDLPKPPSGPIPWNLQVLDRGGPVRMSLAPPAVFEPAAARSIAPPTNNNESDDGK